MVDQGGVSPETGLFEDTALQIDDGIVANEYLETDVEGVWVAEDNARFQGRRVGRALLGNRRPIEHCPHFYSDVFDLSGNYWGDRSIGDRVVYRGEVESGRFVAWWLDTDNRVVAAFTLGIPFNEAKAVRPLIEEQAQLADDVLTDESRELAELSG